MDGTVDASIYLDRLRGLAKTYDVKKLASFVLKDERFPLWSGAPKESMHHYGKHGLLIHTTEVVDLCLLNNNYFPEDKRVSERDLYLAALFHDAGKMWDYAPRANWTQWYSTDHKRRIHHLSRSALVWQKAALDAGWESGLDEDAMDNILHAILAHHGYREHGSPVAPATRLAWLLYLCDSMSARMADCVTFDRFKSS